MNKYDQSFHACASVTQSNVTSTKQCLRLWVFAVKFALLCFLLFQITIPKIGLVALRVLAGLVAELNQNSYRVAAILVAELNQHSYRVVAGSVAELSQT